MESKTNKINSQKESFPESPSGEASQNIKGFKKNVHKIESQHTEPSMNKFDKNYSINFIKKKTEIREAEALEVRKKMRGNSNVNQRGKIAKRQPDEIREIFQIRKYGAWL